MGKICDDCLLGYCSYEPHSEDCQSARFFETEDELNGEHFDSSDLNEYFCQSNNTQKI